MSEPREPLPAKLIAGLLYHDRDIQKLVLSRVVERFGPLDLLTEPELFTYTRYYDREMGPGLFRQTASFLRLVPIEDLPGIKLFTNEIERELAVDGKRRINIDPGLLNEERLILATGKNFTHRVYLTKGIYADLTLIYRKGTYRELPWTYPDYKSPRFLHFLGVLRKKLIFQRDGVLPL